ncbi:ABC transporter substrate-binding protein [Meiothermus sp.]|uniref:ABC transporter substrate-binding protein n=1 Tax=Meiothermus sp. TaxID=1955249 RepID=UPI00307E84D6
MRVWLGWLALVLVLSVGLAQQRTLTVSGFGLNQNLIDKNITRPFEARCNCKIVWEVGNNADRLAKLAARKDNPNVDVALLGDYFAQLAANQGLLERLDTSKLSNLNELYDFAKNPLGGNFAVAFTTYAISIAYRTDKITTPITSWRDLWRPELKGRIALPNITTTQGPPVVWLVNRAFGGTDTNVNPGFERLSALKANVVTYYNQSAQLAGLFAQEEVWAAPVGRFAWGNLLATGKPLAWARLSEGQAGVSNVAVLVKGSRNQELAYQFIDFIISREVQTAQANDLVDSPVNRNVRVSADKAAQLTYGLQQIASLRTVDPDYIIKVRDAWIQRWNREVAR